MTRLQRKYRRFPRFMHLERLWKGINYEKEMELLYILCDSRKTSIDVGAKLEIYQLINQLVANGKSVLMISSELPEVLGMSDRILVMHEGRVTGEISDVENTTQEDIMNLAVGGLEDAA